MTKVDLPGPSLNEAQWGSLRALATSLTAEQSNWVGGYFTGYADAVRLAGAALAPTVPQPPAPQPATQGAQRTLTVLYGSETGNGLEIAEVLAAKAAALGIPASAVDMESYKPATLKQEQDLLVVTSTHGEGEPPQPALAFFEYLDSRKAPRLEGLRFAVMALGDSTYEFYCEAGKRLDRRLEELGGERLKARIDCDVDELKAGRAWGEEIVATLAQAAPAAAAAAVPAAAAVTAAVQHGEANPFLAPVIENLVITGRGSSKETRHIEIGLEGSGLSYEPGDALGIVGRNDRRVVEELLGSLGLAGSEQVRVDDAALPLAEALTARFEIQAATPRFLNHWAELAGADDLRALTAADKASERFAFLEANHIVDFVRNYPVPGISAETFIGGLRALQRRLYSIASSQQAQDGDVHLTVSTVRYDLHGSERRGVVSGALGRLDEEANLPVYIKANPHFRLPADDVPIIMIGAGTGVAPYRAFLQERELRGARGRSWLFFGERNFRSDFLYQTEWQGHLKSGVLTWMDVAFSRDGADKHYVQHRLIERGHELYGWLQDGAALYVCGDAKGMAPDVHEALVALVARAGAMERDAAEAYVRDLQRDGRYQRDVY
jgi:sulfite reductase (NADPH) flavoprotein alpha-component